MSFGIRLLLIPALLFARCEKKAEGFSHDFTFDMTSGNIGYTTPQTTSDPNDLYTFTADFTGTDPLDPADVELLVVVECGNNPGVEYTRSVAVRSVGLTGLVADYSGSAPECIDSSTGQKSSASWHIQVRRVEPAVGFVVKIQGTLG